MKALRIVALAVMTVASVATATTPSQKDIKDTVILSEGGSPVPLCRPGSKVCK